MFQKIKKSQTLKIYQEMANTGFLSSIPWFCWVIIGLAISLLVGILNGKFVEGKRREMEAVGLLRKER